jgi:hypothetical protein
MPNMLGCSAQGMSTVFPMVDRAVIAACAAEPQAVTLTMYRLTQARRAHVRGGHRVDHGREPGAARIYDPIVRGEGSPAPAPPN